MNNTKAIVKGNLIIEIDKATMEPTGSEVDLLPFSVLNNTDRKNYLPMIKLTQAYPRKALQMIKHINGMHEAEKPDVDVIRYLLKQSSLLKDESMMLKGMMLADKTNYHHFQYGIFLFFGIGRAKLHNFRMANKMFHSRMNFNDALEIVSDDAVIVVDAKQVKTSA